VAGRNRHGFYLRDFEIRNEGQRVAVAQQRND
jgi:hypothetical protein